MVQNRERQPHNQLRLFVCRTNNECEERTNNARELRAREQRTRTAHEQRTNNERELTRELRDAPV